MSPQLFSNTHNKARDKLKNKLEMEIFVETHTWKKLWSNGTTEQQLNLNNLKNKIETLLKFEARR
jgi:hypothetical protein